VHRAAESCVEREIPTRVVVVVLDVNIIAIPIPIAAVRDIIGRDDPVGAGASAPVMYLFNGLLLLLFAASVFRVFGGAVAQGALLFVLIDPSVAAHWPVVMTDLPVGLLSVTRVLACIELLRNWTWANVGLLSITPGLAL
jgi:hypothetical protein